MVVVKAGVMYILLLTLLMLLLCTSPITVESKRHKGRLTGEVYKIAGGQNAAAPGVGALSSFSPFADDRNNPGPSIVFGNFRRQQPYRRWQNYQPYNYDYYF
ncbi:hypothetical protein OTU49_009430 [Cherax quadricarinatus]|uniref:Uncharacterized protein n=1 Tax=Cherax quadricarinatus TaxID=27406 RepID=A0AAW0WA04_CHEQU|nr:uncharacterized protein LOC128700106 [Cherax quadricarinatus]